MRCCNTLPLSYFLPQRWDSGELLEGKDGGGAENLSLIHI